MGFIGWIITVPAVLIGLLILIIGFYEGRKAFWDYKVTQMCEKDGGVTIIEQINISEKDYKKLIGLHSGLALPNIHALNRDYPYYYETHNTRIREANPEVVQGKTIIKRRFDQKILGYSIHYWRRGGDIPTGIAHDSSFICPQHTSLMSKVFKINGG